jgi:hypothetical protein
MMAFQSFFPRREKQREVSPPGGGVALLDRTRLEPALFSEAIASEHRIEFFSPSRRPLKNGVEPFNRQAGGYRADSKLIEQLPREALSPSTVKGAKSGIGEGIVARDTAGVLHDFS